MKPKIAVWNAAVGHGRWSPLTVSTTTKNTIENGKPNRKRMLVAPQVPSGPVNCRCIALRATWPSAAVTVKGIQSVAMLNMGIRFDLREIAATLPGETSGVNHKRRHDSDAKQPTLSSSLPSAQLRTGAGTHNPGNRCRALALNEQIAEITPFQVIALY